MARARSLAEEEKRLRKKQEEEREAFRQKQREEQNRLDELKRQEAEKQQRLRSDFNEKTKKATQFNEMPSEKVEKGKGRVIQKSGSCLIDVLLLNGADRFTFPS